MVRKLQKILLAILAAALLFFAAWMLWPRSVGDAADLWGREIAVTITTSGWEEIQDEGNFYNQPTMDMERYTIQPGSGQAALVLGLLDQYSYHLCWDTLTGETAISGIGSLGVALYDAQGGERELNVYSGTGKIRLNGRIVRLGYLGNGTAEELSRELARLIRDGSGVAN